MIILGLTIGEWGTIGGAIVGVGSLVVGYVRLQSRAAQYEQVAQDALRVAREAREQVQAVRLEMAQKYASVSYLKEVETRLVGSMDRLTDRIDKLLESFSK